MTILERLRGKKTYLLAGLLVVVAILAGAMGRMSVALAGYLLVFAAAGFAGTFRAAIEQHHEEEMILLEDLGALGVQVAAHNYPAAAGSLAQAATLGSQLAQEIERQTDSQTERPADSRADSQGAGSPPPA